MTLLSARLGARAIFYPCLFQYPQHRQQRSGRKEVPRPRINLPIVTMLPLSSTQQNQRGGGIGTNHADIDLCSYKARTEKPPPPPRNPDTAAQRTDFDNDLNARTTAPNSTASTSQISCLRHIPVLRIVCQVAAVADTRAAEWDMHRWCSVCSDFAFRFSLSHLSRRL